MMLGLLAVGLGVVFGATVGRYLVRQVSGNAGLPAAAAVGSAGVALAGVWLAVASTTHLQAEFARRQWPTVTGTVIQSRVVGTARMWTWEAETNRVKESELSPEDPVKRDRNYRPEVTCEYVVDGQPHRLTTDCQVPGFGGKLNRLDVAVKTLIAYPEGAEVKVFHNPANPAESLLRPGPTWDLFARVALGVVLIAIGAGGLLAGWPRQAGRS